MNAKKSKNKSQERDSQFRSNLLALVSHELNTPLTGICNAISVLEERYPEDRDFLPMLRRNSERLRRTVENMLTLAEADAGLLRVHLTEVMLENLLQRELEKARAHGKNCEWVTNFEQDLPNICADPQRLGRVFRTLLENAVKFSETRSKNHQIHVSLQLQPIAALANIPIENEIANQTGIFLTVNVDSPYTSAKNIPENIEDLFEPFNPWKDVHTREKEGLGIDLPLAQEIMRAHRGFLFAENIESRFMRFSFGVPVLSRKDELEFVINNRIHGAMGMLSKTSILVVRPDPEMLLESNLEQSLKSLEAEIRGLLYRSSDSVFYIPASGEITIVLDDCNITGATKLASRFSTDLRKRLPQYRFIFGIATGPDHGTNAKELLDFASHNWQPVATER